MAKNLTTKLHYTDNQDTLRVIVLGRPSVSLEEEVDLYFYDKYLGTYFVEKITITTLSDLNQKQLNTLPSRYKNKSVLWNRLERVYESGLPGEFEISLIDLSVEDPTIGDSNYQSGVWW